MLASLCHVGSRTGGSISASPSRAEPNLFRDITQALALQTRKPAVYWYIRKPLTFKFLPLPGLGHWARCGSGGGAEKPATAKDPSRILYFTNI